MYIYNKIECLVSYYGIYEGEIILEVKLCLYER